MKGASKLSHSQQAGGLPQNSGAPSGTQGRQKSNVSVSTKGSHVSVSVDETPGAEGEGWCPLCGKWKKCVSEYIKGFPRCLARLEELELPLHAELKEAMQKKVADDE